MEHAVTREGTALVTLHEGTDTTACSAARTQLADRLETLAAEGSVSDWSIADAEVYEGPTGPFDPYTIAVSFAITVTVEATDAATAETAGASAIDEALDAADVASVSYSSDPVSSAA